MTSEQYNNVDLNSSMKISRDAKILILSNAIGSLPWGYFSVLQAIYLDIIGIEPTLIGMLMTFSGLTSALLAIPFGILSDRYGRKPFLITSGFLYAFSMLIYVITIKYVYLAVASVIGGLAGAMFFPPWQAILADKSTHQNREKVFSYSAFASSTAITIGSLLSVIPDYLQIKLGIGEIASYKPMFLLASILAIISTLLLFSVSEIVKKRMFREIFPRKSAKIIAKFCLTGALIGFGAGFIIPLFSLWFYLKFGLGGIILGPLFAISNAVMAIAFLAAPKLAKIIGTVNTIILTQAMATVLLAIIPLVPDFRIVSVLYVVRNFLMNMSHPIQSAFMMSLVEPEERASASSITGTAWSIPNSISPSIGGYIMEHLSLSLPFHICAAHYTASIIFFYLFFHKVKPSEGRDIKIS
jgi:MFS family permease